MRLKDIKSIHGTIIVKTGLHIGAGDTEMRIGGVDNPVIKHPYTQEPYIPGSSLKGKVRSLLELKTGLMGQTGGKPVSAKDLKTCESGQQDECEKILKIFGSSGADAEEEPHLGPTRASFSDCHLDDEWKERTIAAGYPFTEVKSENSINRIKGTALNPRFTERVPATAQFRFSVSIKELDGDSGLFEYLLEGLKLLESDSLGGSGSRGYGRIAFRFDDETIQQQFDGMMILKKEG